MLAINADSAFVHRGIDVLEFTPLNDVSCELGESPLYDRQRNALWYCDIVNKTLYQADLKTGATRRWSFASEVGSLGLADSGRLVVALRHTIGLFDPEGDAFRELAVIEPDRADTRLNDGKVGPDGAFWVGSMDNRGLPRRDPLGSLYRVTADGKVEPKVDGLRVSNGLAFSPDGRTMFHSDSTGKWIDRWNFNPTTGDISNRTRIAEPDDATGRPDGAATDAEGFYWSAGVSAARLNRFAPDGRLVESYPVPVAAPTMPCFGGPDLKTLFVTGLRTGRAPELLQRYPLSGTTIVAESPVAGAPVPLFRGA
ncbi:MAG: SMP-30/gluconolactonase/LRE family protein [Bauldia sp.]